MKKQLVLAALAFGLSVYGMNADAEFYRYIDKSGAQHSVNDISLVPPEYRNQLKDSRGSAAGPPSSVKQREERKKAEFTGTVEIFITSWCPYCKKLQKFLESSHIRYTAYDIEEDRTAERRYKALGGRGVPVTLVGTSVIKGYNPEAILKAIERKQ